MGAAPAMRYNAAVLLFVHWQACKTQGCVSCSPLGGFCLEGICQCKLGWEGAGCERSLLGVVSLADSPHNDGFIEGEWYETLEVS